MPRGVGSDKRGAAARLEQMNELMDAGDLELTHLRRRDTAENPTFFIASFCLFDIYDSINFSPPKTPKQSHSAAAETLLPDWLTFKVT